MRTLTARQVGRFWLLSCSIFVAAVIVVRLLGRTKDVKITALWIGYAGLAPIGVALFLTWSWLGDGGPRSLFARAPLRLALIGGVVLWLLALVFPFL
ncbi:MAG TPA: hypothetical protein VGH98_20070 [Gemmatimonadaceae bacterium]|jgi:hypothetical protein